MHLLSEISGVKSFNIQIWEARSWAHNMLYVLKPRMDDYLVRI